MADQTQRAYTFKIARSESDGLLERTHLATNAGASAALHWMLSLCGGLSAARGVDAAARLMLARGWLSVESREGAPLEFIVAQTEMREGVGGWQTEAALDGILLADGVAKPEREAWLAEARDAINASLRDDAVWVNRRAAFDSLVIRFGSISQGDLDDFFFDSGLFEKPRFFAVDVAPEAPDCIRGVSQWLSRRFGTGSGADFVALSVAYGLIADALDAAPAARTSTELSRALGIEFATPGASVEVVANLVGEATSAPGHKSRTKTLIARALSAEAIDDEAFERLRLAARGDAATCAAKPKKGALPYADAILASVADACGFTYAGKPARHAPYVVMFDLAARRFAGVRSFIRNAERARAEYDVAKLTKAVPSDALAWCDAYALANGVIRRRGLGRWDEVVTRWRTCKDALERVEALRAIQKMLSREKLGNANLFAEIAVDEAAASLRSDASLLPAYVALSDAREAVAARKAPMLRHIDAVSSPVWIEFGVSRWPISMTPTETGALVKLTLLGEDGPTEVTLRAAGARFVADLGAHIDGRGPTLISRADRIGMLAADAADADSVTLAAPLKWNGRLHFDRRATKQRRSWTLSFSASLKKRRIAEPLVAYLRENLAANVNRGTSVRQNLGRYPGLRVMGVNLGLRVGAACAILETVSAAEIQSVTHRAGISIPTEDALYFSVPAAAGRTRYRRIGAEALPDGTPHPCPWARIEQRFLVRLPGESHDDVRKASSDEVALAQDLAMRLSVPIKLARRVDELQANALRAMRRALARHGRIGAACYALGAFSRGELGAERLHVPVERLTAISTYDAEIEAILARHGFDPNLPEHSLAAALAGALEALWRGRDPLLQAALGRLRSWLQPSAPSLHIGGLGLTRLGNLRALRSAQVAFTMRPQPDSPLNSDRVGIDYGRSLLEAIARLRQERARQLVSRIVGAAVGGSRREAPASVRQYEPVQAIVIEDLGGFRPDQSRSRRENTTLATWANAQLHDLLSSSCELNGVILRTVVGAYTSQEDGFTGAVGMRVTAVPVETFVEAPWWREALESALARTGKKAETEEDRTLLAWHSRWDESTGTWIDEKGRSWTRQARRWVSRYKAEVSPRPITLPDPEGRLFISLDSGHPISADANAAVTVGMHALLDPDWAGAFSHVATTAGIPLAERVHGSACFRKVGDLAPIGDVGAKASGSGIINAWRTRSARPISDGKWYTARTHFAMVKNELSQRLRLPVSTGERSTGKAS